jgi:putative ABC transport system permease protein
MNLSTARSSKRSAEVGIRKVLGAEKRSLIAQFLGESLLLSLIGFILALIITQLLLPLFSTVAGKDFSFSLEQHAVLLLAFFVLAVITGLLAGSYPAFYLSSFKPVKVLKGKLSNSLAAISLRKILVVFQFVISVILIVASVVITNQMHYMRTKDLGFIKEQQIIVPLRSTTAKKIYPSLRSELSNITAIRSVGASAYYPGIMNPSDMALYKQGQSMNEARRVYMNYVDENYLQTLGIKPLAGRLFSKEFIGDTIARVILNESAIKQIGFTSPEDAIGKNVMMDWQGKTMRLEVIAVVNDFHFQGLHTPIEPYGFQLSDGNYSYLIAHAQTKDIAATLGSVESAFHKLNPNEPFEYTFLDEDFAKNYAADEKLSAIVGYFTIIAIFISCLGLFGLATFSAEQRIKEIGVRKVLGASVTSIVTLLSTDFLKLVIIAIMIASPIAWWAMNKWLQDFAYRTSIGWWIFIIAGLGALIIALITISFQAIRAAVSNPVKSLRTE